MSRASISAKIKSHPERGFTLIELLVVLAIVAVIAYLAAPNYSSTLAENRLQQERLSLATGLALARSEAIQRGENVSICAGNNSTCSGSDSYVSTGFEWVQGWRVYVAGEGLLRRGEKQNSTVKVLYDCGAYVTFSPAGERASTASRDDECTFTFTDSEAPSLSRSLAIARSGRVRMF